MLTVELSSVKYLEHPFSHSRVSVCYGQTDIAKLSGAFLQFFHYDRAQKTFSLLHIRILTWFSLKIRHSKTLFYYSS
jgi:hypothetical protein